jgi:hypothetical protein
MKPKPGQRSFHIERQIMKLTKSTFFLGCLIGGMGASVIPLLLSTSRGGETKLLPFQGRLTNADGSITPDQTKVVEFKMYDAPTGGSVKWAGEVHKLSVNGGLVNTMLGSKAGLGSVDFAEPTFLQITVDANGDGQITAADPPLLPRQSVIPALFAAVAGQMQYVVPAVPEANGNPEIPAQVKSAGWDAVFEGGRPGNGRINGAKIKDGGIGTVQLAANSVTSVQIAPEAVTTASVKNGSLLVEDFALGQVIRSDLGQAAGDILFFNGTNWARLPTGPAGFFLQSQGPAAAPVWVPPIGLGEQATRSVDIVYQATTDGFLTARTTVLVIGAGSPAKFLEIRSDPSNPPVTLRARQGTTSSTTALYGFVTCPIKKNDYYRIIDTTGVSTEVYFTPLQ